MGKLLILISSLAMVLMSCINCKEYKGTPWNNRPQIVWVFVVCQHFFMPCGETCYNNTE